MKPYKTTTIVLLMIAITVIIGGIAANVAMFFSNVWTDWLISSSKSVIFVVVLVLVVLVMAAAQVTLLDERGKRERKQFAKEKGTEADVFLADLDIDFASSTARTVLTIRSRLAEMCNVSPESIIASNVLGNLYGERCCKRDFAVILQEEFGLEEHRQSEIEGKLRDAMSVRAAILDVMKCAHGEAIWPRWRFVCQMMAVVLAGAFMIVLMLMIAQASR